MAVWRITIEGTLGKILDLSHFGRMADSQWLLLTAASINRYNVGVTYLCGSIQMHRLAEGFSFTTIKVTQGVGSCNNTFPFPILELGLNSTRKAEKSLRVGWTTRLTSGFTLKWYGSEIRHIATIKTKIWSLVRLLIEKGVCEAASPKEPLRDWSTLWNVIKWIRL